MEVIRNNIGIGLPLYPEYKASDVEWFGDIPIHWRMPRLGSVLQERAEINVDGKVEQVLSVLRDIGVILYEEKGEIGNKRSEDITRYKIVRPDDLVVNSMNVIIGSVGLSKYTGCLSPVYYVLKPCREDVSSGYYGRVFQLKLFQESLVRLGNGILAHRMRIPMEKLKAEHIPQPPLDEQQAIVRYLDHIDRRVRRYIRAKQRLLALLREQKQAIIHQAVTRGLDASAPLKPSGVAWLGEVPAHWEVWQVAHFAKVGNGSTPSRSNPGYWNRGEFPWLNSASVNHGRITASDQYVTDLALKECHLPIINPGSILIAITGQGKTRGTAALLEMEATINQHIAFITPRSSRVLPDYLLLFLRAAYADLRRISDDAGGTKGALTCEDIKHYKILVPPLGEQRSLVETVRHQTERIDFVMHRTQREIDLIREYRTRLIADVVTGKVDVRAAAAALPAEVGEEAVWAASEVEEDGEEGNEEELQRMQTENG